MINIKQQRNRLGISQEELANFLEISRPTLLKIEKGERSLKEEEREKILVYFEDVENMQYGDEKTMRIDIPEKNEEKFEEILLYILQEVGARPNVGLTVIYKLLYFIDFDYYEKYKSQIMGLTYMKNTHGPTPREFKKVIDKMKQEESVIEVKSVYFKREQKKFLPHRKPRLNILDGQELSLIDDVLERYADKSARELSDMSHRDTPWRVAEKGANLEYEHAFYRPEEFSVGEYEQL